jgi:hypothetical protein
MLQKCDFDDTSAAYVAADDTSTRHVDISRFHRHEMGGLVGAAAHQTPNLLRQNLKPRAHGP